MSLPRTSRAAQKLRLPSLSQLDPLDGVHARSFIPHDIERFSPPFEAKAFSIQLVRQTFTLARIVRTAYADVRDERNVEP
jgi:hypothetical protein